MNKDPFEEYLREKDPDRVEKGYAWSTAIGLQAVDGIKPSQYLIDTAIQNIEGEITIKEHKILLRLIIMKSLITNLMMIVVKMLIKFLHVLR